MLIPLLGTVLSSVLAQQPPAPSFQASTWIVPWDLADADDAGLACFTEVDPFAFVLDPSGAPKLAHPELLPAARRAPGRLVLPVIVNDVVDSRGREKLKSAEILTKVLADDRSVDRHVASILRALPLDEVDGVEIDYERVPLGAWPRFADFIERLGRELHARGKRLHLDVESDLLSKEDGGRNTLGAAAQGADAVKVMAYYQRGGWSEIGPGNSLWWIVDVARRAAEVIPPEKLSIALSMAGTDWELPAPRVASLRRVERLHYDKVLDLLASADGKQGWSEEESAPYFDYALDGARHRLWYEDSRSIAAKVAALRGAGVSRVALWYVGKRHLDLSTSGLCPP